MSETPVYVKNPELDLVLERIVDVPVNLVWDAWTKPEHIVHWFTPAPYKTVHCEIDLRPGGIFLAVMRSPEGQEFGDPGCFLEVIPQRKLVFTDALGPGFRPKKTPFFTGMILLEPHGEGTKYTAIAIHPDAESKTKHEEMGFFQGWGTALDQLVAYMKTQ